MKTHTRYIQRAILQRDCPAVPEWDSESDKSGYGSGQIALVTKHFCSGTICKDLHGCWFLDDGKDVFHLPVNGNDNVSKLKVQKNFSDRLVLYCKFSQQSVNLILKGIFALSS